MFLTWLKRGTVVLLTSCAIASLTGLAPEHTSATEPAQADGDGAGQDESRLFTQDRTLMFVNVCIADPKADRMEPYDFRWNLGIRLCWIEGIGGSRNLGERISVMRVRLDPDRLRAHKLTFKDVIDAVRPSGFKFKSDWLEEFNWRVLQLEKHELALVGQSWKPEQYGEIILRASPDGDILRLKDVGHAERISTLFDISADVDGYPAATIALKRARGANNTEVIEAVKKKIKHLKDDATAIELGNDELWPTGMEFEAIPFDSQDMIYAVIEIPRGSTREQTSAKCHELGAIAKGIHEVASVTSLAGYQLRTESGGPNVGTCLIHLKDRSDRKLTSRQIIETLQEKCRTMRVHVEFFEPPAVSSFVAAGGFSVRVLDKTNVNNDERAGRVPETFMEDLLNRKDVASLFNFLAGNYPQYELVIDNDVAMQKGVSIASALEKLAIAVGGDDQAERKFRSLVEALTHSFIKNDRGEMVPYHLFMQLKNKLKLNERDV